MEEENAKKKSMVKNRVTIQSENNPRKRKHHTSSSSSLSDKKNIIISLTSYVIVSSKEEMDQRESISLMASASPYYHLQHHHHHHETGLHFHSNPNPGTASALPSDKMHGLGPVQQSELPVVRRKRGRPRKYGHDGGVPLLPNSSNNNPRQAAQKWRHGSGSQHLSSSSSSSSMFSGAGTTMAPHIIRINAGEDIKRRIVSLLHGRRAIVLLSATGSISAANIRSSNSTGSVTYEGHFDMVNLSGSYINDPPEGLSGGLNVTFAGSDGRLIGGPVDGLLIAATPVQVIVGILIPSSATKLKTKDSSSSEAFTDHNLQPSQNLLAPWQS